MSKITMLGLVLGVAVTPASCPERDGAQQVLQRVGDWFKGLRKLWVDGGYTGDTFAQWVRNHWSKLQVEVVKRSDTTGFAVLPRRWVVERTFGWLMRHRRLVRDYERTEASAESWIHLAMIRIQLRHGIKVSVILRIRLAHSARGVLSVLQQYRWQICQFRDQTDTKP